MTTTTGNFAVSDFVPTKYRSEITTGVDVGHAHMVKTFTGAIQGRSLTQFSFAFSQKTGVGTYVAMESFEGTVDGREGSFNLAHTATTDGRSRTHELVTIVPTSGTRDLAGITGSGSIVIDTDGERLVLDYSLPLTA